jgi:regulator of sigma E protease
VNPLLIILAVVVVFGVLVTLHEMGHLLVAKLMGVKVLEFSVGFGPALARIQRGETAYGIRVIPLGGYVKLAGMDDGETGPRSFNAKPVWRRFLIIASGSVTNLLLPLVIFFVAGLLILGGAVRVTSLTPGGASDLAGIPVGAEIVSIDGHRVDTTYQLRQIIRGSNGHSVVVEYRDPSNQAVFNRDLVPRLDQGTWRIGLGTEGGGFDPVGSASDTWTQYTDMVKAIATGFVTLVSGHVPGGLAGNCGPSGPVGIVRATGEAAQAGIVPLAIFAGFLSLNLGILNLMPIPALDGGRLVFLVIEAVRRRPINPLREQMVHQAGLVVLLGLIVLISFNDIARLGQSFSALVASCGG